MLSGFVWTGTGGANQFRRTSFNDVGKFLEVLGNVAHVHDEFVDSFGIDVEGLVDAASDAGDVVQGFPEFLYGGAEVLAIFAEHGVEFLQGLIGLIGGFLEIVKHGAEFSAGAIHIIESGSNQRAIFAQHSLQIGDACGDVGAVLVVEEIVDAGDGDTQIFHPHVEIGQQFLGLGHDLVDLFGQLVEADVLIRGKNGSVGSAGSGWRTRLDFQVIVTQRAETQNGYVAVGLDWKVVLDAEFHVHKSWIFGINLDTFDTADFRPAFVPHRGAALESRGVVELGVKMARGAGKCAGEREYRGDQEGHSDDDEKSDKDLFAFCFHIYL